ncbi:hypothetical protein OIU79_022968 [Salix purpurea]|uniref:Uncharacterized protein n=1 Tax=Salix purpurea TaxID=77065 RepID=A0A9Q0WH12_SALPP|nr:hypothetical protein OIU79_022968 [Salix purpurea]
MIMGRWWKFQCWTSNGHTSSLPGVGGSCAGSGHCCSSYSDGVGGGTSPDLGIGDVNGLVVEMMVLEKDWMLTMVAELGTAVVEMAASVIEVVQGVGDEPAIVGGSGSSSVGGGEPTNGTGGGSGSNENNIPDLFRQALYCTPVNCPSSGACGGIVVYFDYHFN